MANDFDPFGWDDDVEFNPEELQAQSDEGDDYEINDIDQLWDYYDWDFNDLEAYEFHGTGDTGGA
jgi:hypothetical protein